MFCLDTDQHSTDDTPISNTSQQHVESEAVADPTDVIKVLAPCPGIQPIPTMPANSRLVDKLVREAAQGHLQAINAILATNPELVRYCRYWNSSVKYSCQYFTCLFCICFILHSCFILHGRNLIELYVHLYQFTFSFTYLIRYSLL